MPVSPSWPYVESYHADETEAHVRLKNLAVHWLLSAGFSPEDIEDERYTKIGSRSGYTDIYANNGSIEVFIECEHGQAQLSKGGSVPAWDTRPVYVFQDDGIYTVDEVTQTAEPSQLTPGTETIERQRLVMNRLRDLPDEPADT